MRHEQTIALAIGETGKFGDATVRLDAVESGEGPNYYLDRARLTVVDGGAPFAMAPERRYYWAARSPTTEVAIRDTLGSDLYVAFGEPIEATGAEAQAAEPPRWRFRMNRNPLIGAVFIGALMIALGGLLALLGGRSRRIA
jgi:cytochrome c-type biogenesis protein CcmF